MKKNHLLVFPHQLFKNHPGLKLSNDGVSLIEDDLFFGDLNCSATFHKQKLWLHRASMKKYEVFLKTKMTNVIYVEQNENGDTLNEHIKSLASQGFDKLCVTETHDHILMERLLQSCKAESLQIDFIQTPMFLNSDDLNHSYRRDRKRWFMADFYKHQRKRLDILMDGSEPVGGKWSYDEDNRKKVPKKMLGTIPTLPAVDHVEVDREAKLHVRKKYSKNYGSLDELYYPTSHKEAEQWLIHFLNERFHFFGDYEDAIVKNENWLWHSVLTPLLNIGLLTPQQVLDQALKFSHKHSVPLNSLEGFIRQIIGWREFMRATYVDHGIEMRTSNHWKHTRSLPTSFYDATTGIDPIDNVIHRILKTGYCHHIERLMLLGGFMFLCEIHPNQIYKWFMEMFVDSYDWVMVPNVYAMSQHADGGLITTKPYFSGSSYVKKMSNYSTGEWTKVWDGLYWRWIWNHSEELSKNPRWAMMCSMAKKMDKSKRQEHLNTAETFLSKL